MSPRWVNSECFGIVFAPPGSGEFSLTEPAEDSQTTIPRNCEQYTDAGQGQTRRGRRLKQWRELFFPAPDSRASTRRLVERVKERRAGSGAAYPVESAQKSLPITSPAARVPSARQVAEAMLSLTDRTEPSISSALTAPGW